MKFIEATGKRLNGRDPIHELCRNFLFNNIQINFGAQNRSYSIGKESSF